MDRLVLTWKCVFFFIFPAGNEEEEGLIAVKKIQKESGHKKGMFTRFRSDSALGGNEHKPHKFLCVSET